MRRHRQRIVADPARGDGIPGDCLRACVASLLDEPYRAVPHFALYPAWWWDLLRAWARSRGGDVACLRVVGGSVRQFLAHPDDDPAWDGLLIGCGASPRGPYRHVVLVDVDLDLVYDPHPSGAGLLEVDEVYAFVAPYDPPPPEFHWLEP